MITVWGASDDLIEVEGDIREEFTLRDDHEGDLLGFSDGTLLNITYNRDGIWRITPVVRGSSFVRIDQTTDDGGDYSDRAYLANANWLVQGVDFAIPVTPGNTRKPGGVK